MKKNLTTTIIMKKTIKNKIKNKYNNHEKRRKKNLTLM
jgi:hypothetical protein